MMRIEQHPTAARKTAISIIGYVLLLIAAGTAGDLLEAHNILAHGITFWILVGLALLGIAWCATVGRRCKCPTCRSALRWQGRLSERGTMVFECPKCDRAWDVGYWTGAGFG